MFPVLVQCSDAANQWGRAQSLTLNKIGKFDFLITSYHQNIKRFEKFSLGELILFKSNLPELFYPLNDDQSSAIFYLASIASVVSGLFQK